MFVASRTYKSLKGSLLSGVAAIVFGTVSGPTIALAQSTIACGPTGITFTIPDSYQMDKEFHPQVLCQIIHKVNGFPTFNIVRTPPSDTAHLDANVMMRRLTESYHQVGLTDARAEMGEYVTASGQRAFQSILTYSNKGTSMTSFVLVFERPDDTLTLTATQRSADYPATAREIEAIAHSLSLPGEASEVASEAQANGHILPSLIALVALTVVAVALVVAKLRGGR